MPGEEKKKRDFIVRHVNNTLRNQFDDFHLALHSLQGALGKTSGRSYKAAPRQLLQVDTTSHGASSAMSLGFTHVPRNSSQKSNEGAAQEAAKLGREALGNAGGVSEVKYAPNICFLTPCL
jgi:DNA topoisomerase 2-associated protein PAT1